MILKELGSVTMKIAYVIFLIYQKMENENGAIWKRVEIENTSNHYQKHKH